MYRALWRWHFYVGLLVIPFLLMLCVTGLLMLGSKPVGAWLDRELTTVVPEGDALPASALMATVRAQHPHANVTLYIPAGDATESARFSLTQGAHAGHAGHGAPSTTVYVNPYNGDILGSRDPTDTFYEQVKNVHGTLLIGKTGDLLIEGAAGLAILMVLSGLYLSWSRQSRDRNSNGVSGKRKRWRRWHKLSGWIVAIPLLFFLFSGLAWTSIWGGKLVQPWGSLPGTQFDAPQADTSHEIMNQHGAHQVPWALEQTPMPRADSASQELGIDYVTRIAEQQEFKRYRVHLPQGQGDVWTLSATTMAGDVQNPLAERVLHLDPADGMPLADIRYSDYPAMGMAMAASIPLHQGDLGLWNLLLNMAIIALILFLMTSAVILWWKRRAPQKQRLQPPPADPVASKIVMGLMLVIALCFPVSAAVLALVVVIDGLLALCKRARQKTASGT
ncbi:PepSY-associated TM helix domain-containing protein [Marinimicrobium sp. ARAG 43.8]